MSSIDLSDPALSDPALSDPVSASAGPGCSASAVPPVVPSPVAGGASVDSVPGRSASVSEALAAVGGVRDPELHRQPSVSATAHVSPYGDDDVGRPGRSQQSDDRPISPAGTARRPGGCRNDGAVHRRSRAPCRRARSGRLDAGTPRSGGPGRRLRALVLERAPRSGLPLPTGNRRLRARPPVRPRVLRAFGGRSRRGHPLPEHHRGHQPSGLPIAPVARPTSWSRPSSSITPTCCPGRGLPSAGMSNARPMAPSMSAR